MYYFQKYCWIVDYHYVLEEPHSFSCICCVLLPITNSSSFPLVLRLCGIRKPSLCIISGLDIHTLLSQGHFHYKWSLWLSCIVRSTIGYQLFRNFHKVNETYVDKMVKGWPVILWIIQLIAFEKSERSHLLLMSIGATPDWCIFSNNCYFSVTKAA